MKPFEPPPSLLSERDRAVRMMDRALVRIHDDQNDARYLMVQAYRIATEALDRISVAMNPGLKDIRAQFTSIRDTARKYLDEHRY